MALASPQFITALTDKLGAAYRELSSVIDKAQADLDEAADLVVDDGERSAQLMLLPKFDELAQLFLLTSNDGRNAAVIRQAGKWWDTFNALPGGLDHIMPQRPGGAFNGPQTRERYLAIQSDPNVVGATWGTTAAPTGPQVTPLYF